MENGFFIGELNSRGITTRVLAEGRSRERVLAQRCREAADLVGAFTWDGWHVASLGGENRRRGARTAVLTCTRKAYSRDRL
jgi:hypothetical protein